MNKIFMVCVVLFVLVNTAMAQNSFDYWNNQPVSNPGDFIRITQNWYGANSGYYGIFGLNFWAPQNGNWQSYLWFYR